VTKINRLWFLLLFVKIVLATFIPLFADEAYYWVWSKNLQLSYYDHPGMVAWLFSLGSFFDSFFQACRIPGVILGHCTIWIWFQILKDHIKPQNQALYMIGLSLIPLTGMGGLIITPDLPLLFFWSLALWAFLNDRYVELGAALGLGFCAKYHIVLFPLAAFAYLVLDKKTHLIKWRQLPLALVSFVVFSSPTWIWNLQHDFISFRYQLDHGLGKTTPSLVWPMRYLTDQLLLIFPPIFIFALKRNLKSDLSWLRYFAWTPIIFFLLTSFKGQVEANWPAVAYPAVFSLAFILAQDNLKWIRVTTTIWFSVFILVLSQFAFQWLALPNVTKKMDEIYQYRPVVRAATKPLPLYTSNYQMASLLSFYEKKPFFKLLDVGRRDFFDYLSGSKPTANEFYWSAPETTPLPQWATDAGYKIVDATKIKDNLTLFTVRAP
jgi:4-amino-4-deoxy-L-arabinose transferase-like glycosyltransferase